MSGQTAPTGGYLDMRGNSNSIAGGCIGNCIGEAVIGFTVAATGRLEQELDWRAAESVMVWE
jgi:hypothetical protein